MSDELIHAVDSACDTVLYLRTLTAEVIESAETRHPGQHRDDIWFKHHQRLVNKAVDLLTGLLQCEEEHPHAQSTPIELWRADRFVGYMHGHPTYSLQRIARCGMFGVIYDNRIRLDVKELFSEYRDE